MPQPKRFDPITIIGIAVAIALFYYGQVHMANQRKAQQALADKNAQEEAARQALIVREKSPEAPAGDEKVKPAPKEPDVAQTPDIVIKGDKLELTFSSRGAVLKSARIPGEDENPALKDKKGLDILGPIEPNKSAFGIPNFVFGPQAAQTVFDGKANKSLDDLVWDMKDSGSADVAGNRVVTGTREIKDIKLVKTFTFNTHQRFLRCELTIVNNTAADAKCSYWINGPQGVLLDGPPDDPKGPAGGRVSIQAALAGRTTAAGSNLAAPEVTQLYNAATKAEDDKGRSVSLDENLWAAVKNRFHIATLISLNAPQLVKVVAVPIQGAPNDPDKRKSEPNIGVVGYRSSFDVLKGAAQTDPYALYAGPADDPELDLAESEMKLPAYELHSAVQMGNLFGWNVGWIDWIARMMMRLFVFLHRFFGSFGIAVVMMTIIIKIVMHPVQRNMMVSMTKMQKLQPEMNRIKEKYKDQKSFESKQRMQLEMNDVMSKAGANPLSGCLPMLIQLPVLAALYGIFNNAFDMRGAQFLWIKDLSQPDRLWHSAVPLFGGYVPSNLNLLPLLYVGLSFIQMKITPQAPKQKTGDEQKDAQADMQRQMMMFMPIMISFMFYNMPAGLILYFTASSLFGMLETWYIRNHIVKDKDKGGPPATGTAVVPARS